MRHDAPVKEDDRIDATGDHAPASRTDPPFIITTARQQTTVRNRVIKFVVVVVVIIIIVIIVILGRGIVQLGSSQKDERKVGRQAGR